MKPCDPHASGTFCGIWCSCLDRHCTLAILQDILQAEWHGVSWTGLHGSAGMSLHLTDNRQCVSALQLLHLPEDIQDAMYSASTGAWMSAPCAFLVQGMPVDDVLPDTPIDGRAADDKATYVSEGSLVGLTTLLGGVMFGTATEKEGALVQQVRVSERRQTYS